MEIDKYSIGFVAPSPRNSNKGWTYSPMETLKSAVPDALKQEISNSTPSQLPSTCSSLLHFFHKLPQFHQVLSPLFSTTFFGQNSAILFTLCFFFTIPQMIKDLTDPSVALCCKDRNAALENKLKGNECFSKGEYSNALLFYSKVG